MFRSILWACLYFSFLGILGAKPLLNPLPTPKVEKTEYREVKDKETVRYYASYTFDGAVRVQGIYPHGPLANWPYDVVYSFGFASEYNPRYFKKSKTGITWGKEFHDHFTQYFFSRRPDIEKNIKRMQTSKRPDLYYKKLQELTEDDVRASLSRVAMSNLHFAGWEESCNEAIKSIAPGDIIDVKGYLIDIYNTNGKSWIAKTSLELGQPDDYRKSLGSREYYGCEIMWVTNIKVFKPVKGEKIINIGGDRIKTVGMKDPLDQYWEYLHAKPQAE